MHSMGSFVCPTQPMAVVKVSYQEANNRYFVFHTLSAGQNNMPNPLEVSNLPMQQIASTNGTADYARMSFKSDGRNCNPVLEMTQGFKIEMQQGGETLSARNGAEGSTTSYWTPFLMGAVAGHLLSSGQRSQPAYYPPPHVAPSDASEHKEQKRGFFSKGNSSRRSGGFFRKR